MNGMRRIFSILSLLLPVTLLLVSSASLAETKLEATIFSYDGQDFVRTETTLMKEGQSAAGTKLDHDSAAYKALVENAPTPGQRPFWVETTKPTTHRSPVKTAN